METKRRGRGRPPGTGRDDSPHLSAIARALVADPKLSRPIAMRKVVHARKNWGVSDATVLHRLREKWKMEGEGYMARARQEQAEAEERRHEQERQRRVAAQPTFRDLAAAAGEPGRGWKWPSLAGVSAAEAYLMRNSPEADFIRRQASESRAVWDRHGEAARAALAYAKGPHITAFQMFAEARQRGVLAELAFAGPTALQREAILAEAERYRRMTGVAGGTRFDGQEDQDRPPEPGIAGAR